MRGKPNRYHATAVRLLGTLVWYDVSVNNVPVLRVVPTKQGLQITQKNTRLRINKTLLQHAVEQAN